MNGHFASRWLFVTALFMFVGGCVVPNFPETPEATSETTETAAVQADQPVSVMLMGSDKTDVENLSVGDQLILSVPARLSVAKVSTANTCGCAWSVSPESAGVFDAPEECTTVFTIETTGPAEIAVVQECNGQPTRYSISVRVILNADGVVTNQPPVADAGQDQSVDEGAAVLLNGEGSFDPDDGAVTFSWMQTEGPEVNIENPTSAQASIVAPSVDGTETLTFRLSVSDGEFTDFDSMRVEVSEFLSTAGLVFADAGPDLAVFEGSPVTLDGTGSSGSGLGVLEFIWTQTSGASVDLTGSASATATFIAPQIEVASAALIFNLRVTEGAAASTQSVEVVVLDGDPDSDDGDEDDDGGGDDGGGIGGGDPPPPPPPPSNDGPFMRCVYGGSGVDDLLPPGGAVDRLLEDGIEHYGIKVNGLRAPVASADRDRLRSWGQKLGPANGKLWVFFNWFSSLEENWAMPLQDPYVFPDGTVQLNMPCPQSQHFWDTVITSRFEAVAHITDPDDTEYIPEVADVLAGIVLDPELYQQDNHVSQFACFCEDCFASFFASMGINDPVPPPTERLAYLENMQGIDGVAAYDDFERIGVQALATECREALWAVNPNLHIGGFALVKLVDSPFYLGASQGFGTPDRPMFDFQQRTFSSGYTDGWESFTSAVQDAGIHALLIPGLWMTEIPPEALADHFYTLATISGGAFLHLSAYYGPSEDSLCLPLDDYREQVVAANAELDLREANPNHESPYTGAPFVPPCVDTTPYQVAGGLLPLEDGPADPVGLLWRKETTYFFHADAGDAISLDISMREFGSSDTGSGWWILMSPSGDTMAAEPYNEALSPSLLRVDATETGVHTLLLDNSFVHGFMIDNASHPGSYRRVTDPQWMNLYKGHTHPTEPQLVMYAPPGVTEVGIDFKSSPGEASQVLVFDERDLLNPLFDDVIDTTFNVNLTLDLGNDPAGDGVVLEIVIRNQPAGGAEDLQLRVVSGALPYLSQTRSGLFREP